MNTKPNSGSIKKGEVRNPHGRPRTGKAFADILRKTIDQLSAVKKDKDGTEKVIKGNKVLSEALVQIAMDKNNNANVRLSAMNMILDRAYGKPIQTVEQTTTIQKDRTYDIKASLEKLTPDERDTYIELCEKANADNSEQ